MFPYSMFNPAFVKNAPQPHHRKLIQEWGLDTEKPKHPPKTGQPAAAPVAAKPRQSKTRRKMTMAITVHATNRTKRKQSKKIMTPAEKLNVSTNNMISAYERLAESRSKSIAHLKTPKDFSEFDMVIKQKIENLKELKAGVRQRSFGTKNDKSGKDSIEKINNLLDKFNVMLDEAFDRAEEMGWAYMG